MSSLPPPAIARLDHFCAAVSFAVAPARIVTARLGLATCEFALKVTLPKLWMNWLLTSWKRDPLAGVSHVGGRSMLLITGSSEYCVYFFAASQWSCPSSQIIAPP